MRDRDIGGRELRDLASDALEFLKTWRQSNRSEFSSHHLEVTPDVVALPVVFVSFVAL